MADKPEPPNVIVFFTDQQRWDTTGVHGNPLGLTTNFDRMALRGTHVFNSFTCQPVCAPARASLQTGLYATRTSVYRNGIALPQEMRTLAHNFRDAGYQTACIEKWHLSSSDPYKLTNLAGLECYQELGVKLGERLIRRMREAGEHEPTISPAAPRPSGQRSISLVDFGPAQRVPTN